MKGQGATLKTLAEAERDWKLKYSKDAWEGAALAMEDFGEKYKTETQRVYETTLQLANSIRDNFTNAFMSMIDGTKSAKDAFKDMTKSIIMDLIRIQIQQQITSAIGSFAGGGKAGTGILGWLGSLFHGGGVVGQTHVPQRAVPIQMFANAPRLHKGLQNDEYPAILQKGETVTPAGQTPGGGKFYINNDFTGATFLNEGQLESAIRIISAEMVQKLAPNAIINSYNNDQKIRSVIRSGR